jgi:hypothetical protein
MSASQWRSGGSETYSKNRKTIDKKNQPLRNWGKAFSVSS